MWVKKENSVIDRLQMYLCLQAAVDHGGPRKELFRLALNEIRMKYFEKGLRDFMSADYLNVGKIMGKN